MFFWKTSTKYYCDKGADFHDTKMPKVGSIYTCLAIILTLFAPCYLDLIFYVGERKTKDITPLLYF